MEGVFVDFDFGLFTRRGKGVFEGGFVVWCALVVIGGDGYQLLCVHFGDE